MWFTYQPEDSEEFYIKFSNGILNLTGISIPQNAVYTWLPFIDDLNAYAESGQDLVINFNFKMLNTSSSRFVMTAMKILDSLAKKASVEINWHYYKEDEDMLAIAETCQDVIDVKINLVEKKLLKPKRR